MATRIGRRQLLHLAGLGTVGGLLLTACGGAPPTTTPPPKQDTTSATTPAPKQEAQPTASSAPKATSAPASANAVKIKFMAWAVDAKWLGGWDRSVEEFNRRNQNVQAEFQWSPIDGWEQKIMTMVSGGIVPDVVNTFLSVFLNLAGKGVLTPLDDYVKASKTVNLDDIIPMFRESGIFKSKRYGLPFSGGGFFYYYNDDAFKAAGVPAPKAEWTWKDFQEAAVRLTKREGDRVTQWGGDRGNWRGWVLSAGGKVTDDSLKKCLLDSPEAIEGLQFLQDMIHTHKALPTNEALQEADNQAMFMSGRSAMGYTNSTLAQKMGNDMKFKWNAVVVPKGPGGQFCAAGANNTTLQASSKYKDEAYLLVEWVTSTEGLMTRGLPEVTRKSQLEHPDLIDKLDPTFQGPGRTRDFVNIIMQANLTGVMPPMTPMWLEAETEINRQLDNLWFNRKPAAQVAKDIVAAVDPILQQWEG